MKRTRRATIKVLGVLVCAFLATWAGKPTEARAAHCDAIINTCDECAACCGIWADDLSACQAYCAGFC